MAYSSVLFSCLCLDGLEKDGTKLLTTNLYGIINAIRSFSLSVKVSHLWNHCRSLSKIDYGGVGKLRHIGTHIILVHIHSNYMLISSSKVFFWELSLFNEAIFKSNLKNLIDHLAQSTVRCR